MKKLVLTTGQNLKLKDIEDVLGDPALRIAISREAMAGVEAARIVVDEAVANDEIVYGINTGFGKLSSVKIEKKGLSRLQKNLIMSHASGVGEPLDVGEARLAMVLRINAIIKGHSGVRPRLVNKLVEIFNAKIVPVIPRQGSVGASGDLAPLAHMALVPLGLGEVFYRGKRMETGEAFARAGVKPIIFKSKEGLALINGTQIMTAVAARALVGAYRAVRHADVAAAMTVEALKGTDVPFDDRIAGLRPQTGHAQSARNVRRLLSGSWILASHVDCSKVQDPYCLRCVPQVHGASRGAFRHVEDVVTTEFNAVTDNPLIFPDVGDILSGGNFHGQPVAIASDYLGVAIAELGSISERRIENLVNPELSGLPAFLARRSGLHSGYMVAQVTAAALVSENKIYAHPASVDSIPTSANKEDHVSMGTIAAFKAARILANVEYVLAVEFLCAAEGLEYRGKLNPGKGVMAAYRAVRKEISPLRKDRVLSVDVEKVAEMIRGGTILEAVEKSIGPLE
jgi:histidine ammonia-lyase